MHTDSRPRRPSLRTLALLALFALGLAMQPLGEALGELHEHLAHGQDIAAHADASHDHAGDDPAGDDDTMAHALSHVVHCCGHMLALPQVPTLRLSHRPDATAFAPESAAHAPPHAARMLRPPIFG